MTEVVSFEDFTPPVRYDAVPWTQVRIEEALTQTGTYAAIDTINLSPLDSDPANPASRSFTTSNATAEGLWYQMVFLDGGGNDSLPTYPIQNLPQREPYATVNELALLVRVNATDRHAALHRALAAAADEIDSEIGTADISGVTLPYGNPPPLVRTVNLERAVEHWKQAQSPFGLVNVGDVGSMYTARDSWDRHAHKLQPLKGGWGIA
jgi:hypothetical protein